MANLAELLFPPCLRFSAFVDLPPARGAGKRKKKTTRRSQTRLFLTSVCVCFCIYSIVSALAGFPVVRLVAFRSHCELHDNCVSAAPHREIMQNNRERRRRGSAGRIGTSLYIPAIHLMRLTNMCEVYVLRAAPPPTTPPPPFWLNIPSGRWRVSAAAGHLRRSPAAEREQRRTSGWDENEAERKICRRQMLPPSLLLLRLLNYPLHLQLLLLLFIISLLLLLLRLHSLYPLHLFLLLSC